MRKGLYYLVSISGLLLCLAAVASINVYSFSSRTDWRFPLSVTPFFFAGISLLFLAFAVGLYQKNFKLALISLLFLSMMLSGFSSLSETYPSTYDSFWNLSYMSRIESAGTITQGYSTYAQFPSSFLLAIITKLSSGFNDFILAKTVSMIYVLTFVLLFYLFAKRLFESKEVALVSTLLVVIVATIPENFSPRAFSYPVFAAFLFFFLLRQTSAASSSAIFMVVTFGTLVTSHPILSLVSLFVVAIVILWRFIVSRQIVHIKIAIVLISTYLIWQVYQSIYLTGDIFIAFERTIQLASEQLSSSYSYVTMWFTGDSAYLFMKYGWNMLHVLFAILAVWSLWTQRKYLSSPRMSLVIGMLGATAILSLTAFIVWPDLQGFFLSIYYVSILPIIVRAFFEQKRIRLPPWKRMKPSARGKQVGLALIFVLLVFSFFYTNWYEQLSIIMPSEVGASHFLAVHEREGAFLGDSVGRVIEYFAPQLSWAVDLSNRYGYTYSSAKGLSGLEFLAISKDYSVRHALGLSSGWGESENPGTFKVSLNADPAFNKVYDNGNSVYNYAEGK